jgi:thiamine monophosphate synthase
MPLCAIGGIDLGRAPAVLESGADAVAVISALTGDWEALPAWQGLFPAAHAAAI